MIHLKAIKKTFDAISIGKSYFKYKNKWTDDLKVISLMLKKVRERRVKHKETCLSKYIYKYKHIYITHVNTHTK